MWIKFKDKLIELAIAGLVKAGLREKLHALVDKIADKIEARQK